MRARQENPLYLFVVVIQRARPADEQRPHQARAGVPGGVHGRAVHPGQAGGVAGTGPNALGHGPAVREVVQRRHGHPVLGQTFKTEIGAVIPKVPVQTLLDLTSCIHAALYFAHVTKTPNTSEA